MRASEELARRQREYPVGALGDRGATLFAGITPFAAEVEKLRAGQMLVVGEVGRTLPNAKTFHYSDGSHAIMLYSGLIDFLDAVAQILFGATNLYTGKEVIQMSFGVDTVIVQLQGLFERWKPGGISDVVDPALAITALPPLAAADAAMMAEAAQLFILSHEFGHVTFYRAPGDDDDPVAVPALTREQELTADAAGMRNLIQTATGGGEARIRLAGVMISLRVLAVFASLGHTFPNDHPQPIDRLDAIAKSARSFCKTERDYWSLSPIGYAYDEMLEVAGLKALGSSDRASLTSGRMFSRLSSVLEEVAKRSLPRSEAVETMNADFRDAEPGIIDEVALTAARMFPAAPVETGVAGQDVLWADKAKVFQSLRDEWPDAAKKAFQAAFQKTGSQGG